MKNLIAWTQWTFFVIGLGFVLTLAIVGRYLYLDWERLTSISITHCANMIQGEAELTVRQIELESYAATLDTERQMLDEREAKIPMCKKK
jgi:hypothetical protein